MKFCLLVVSLWTVLLVVWLGVTTIAGGSFRKDGYVDGPAQQAQFSNDFDLTFVPGMCALLISDRGNNRIRQIDLKREDCHVASSSGKSVVFSYLVVQCVIIHVWSGLLIK